MADCYFGRCIHFFIVVWGEGIKMLKFQSHMPKLLFRLNGVKIGKHMKLVGWPFLFRYPKAQIQIGNCCSINSSFFANLIGLYQRTIMVARGQGVIEIGDNVGISGSTLYAREKIKIGNHTIIGANTKIFDNDFHHLSAAGRRTGGDLVTKNVTIGNDVFIGCNCIILKGTRIGNGCVVGAGSVVHGEFPEYSVIAGNPARIVKELADNAERSE